MSSARLSNSFLGEWELYVVLDRASTQWPEFAFERTGPVPTLQERIDALAHLSYEITPGAGWEWQEMTMADPKDRVELLASVDVRPIGGAA